MKISWNKRIPREEILGHLRDSIAKGIPIVGSGAGVGISAKAEEMGGTDLIICYNSGYYRMHGRPSNIGTLPLGNANDILLEMAKWILPVVDHTPVIAGVYANDPFRDIPRFLSELADMGFSGVQNFPTMGTYSGRTRQLFEDNGYSYDNEVEMIKAAREMGLLTTPYVWNEEEGIKMTEAGADIIVIHAAMTVGGSNGAQTGAVMNLEQAVEMIQRIRDTIVSIREDVIVIAHGGPIAYPADLKYVLQNTRGIHGFYGASSCERLPVEEAVSKRIHEFKTCMGDKK